MTRLSHSFSTHDPCHQPLRSKWHLTHWWAGRLPGSQLHCHRTMSPLLPVCSLCIWGPPHVQPPGSPFFNPMCSLICTLSLFLLVPLPCFMDNGTPSATVPDPSPFVRRTVWHQEALPMSTRTSFLALSSPRSRQCFRVDSARFSKGDLFHCFDVSDLELGLFYCFVFSDEVFCIPACSLAEDDLNLLIFLFLLPGAGIAGMLHHT